MPIDAKQESKKQRLRRLLDNERVTPGTHYQPIVQAALTGLKNQRVDGAGRAGESVFLVGER
jgi:sensor c-di-GMP phosphodiesterase-like protein